MISIIRRRITYRAVKLIYGADARQGLYKGITKLSKAVTTTLGPRGRHVALDNELGNPKVTKDGVTVAKYFGLVDSLENLGAKLVMASAHESNEYAGDGTTTTTLLTHSIVTQGLLLISKGFHPLAVKHGIDLACDQVTAYIKQQSVPITREEEILSLAKVATNYDEKLSEIITSAVVKAGKDGLITVEEGSTAESRLVFSDGMVINRGYSTEAFVTEGGSTDVRFETPLILTVRGKLTDLRYLLPLLEKVKSAQRSLVIVCEDIFPAVQSALLLNLKNKVLSSCAIIYPGGEWSQDMIEDISHYTGSTPFKKEDHLLFAELSNLGSARRVTIDESHSTWFGSCGKVSHRVSQLQHLLSRSAMPEEKLVLKERIKRLSGKMAIIEVGVVGSPVQIGETRDKIIDSLNAVRSGVEEGMLPGGGIVYLYASKRLKQPENDRESEAGIRILKEALKKPFEMLLRHSGVGPYVMEDLLAQNNEDLGVDVLKGKVCDLLQAGVVDSTKVVRQALQTACSLAGMILSTETALIRAKTYTPASLTSYKKEFF